MKKYRVLFQHTETLFVDVEADNEEEANRKALELASEGTAGLELYDDEGTDIQAELTQEI